MTWMRQPSWQGITLFSVRMEFWRSTTIPAIFRLRFVVLVRLAQSSFWNNRLDKSCRVCTAIVRKCFPFFLGVILGAGCACGREACGNRGPLKSHGKLLSDVECESCYSFHSTLKALCHGSHLELVPLYRRLEFAYLKISLLWPGSTPSTLRAALLRAHAASLALPQSRATEHSTHSTRRARLFLPMSHAPKAINSTSFKTLGSTPALSSITVLLYTTCPTGNS
jgi:hypothetical protein